MSGPPRDDSARGRRLDDRTLSSTLSVLEINSGADVFWLPPPRLTIPGGGFRILVWK
jgi:hypothetical protein